MLTLLIMTEVMNLLIGFIIMDSFLNILMIVLLTMQIF